MRASVLIGTANALFCSFAAHATVIYNLNPGTTLTPSGTSTTPLSFELVLDNTFVPGSFSRTCGQGGCYNETGSFSDFELLAYDGTKLIATLDANPDTVFEKTSGTIAGDSGAINWNTSESNFNLTFANGDWSATFNSDLPFIEEPCAGSGCTVTGTISVPEPNITAVLAMMLLGLPLIRLLRNLRVGPPRIHSTI